MRAIELAADRQDGVADRLGVESLAVHPPEEPVVGVDRRGLGVVADDCAIGVDS